MVDSQLRVAYLTDDSTLISLQESPAYEPCDSWRISGGGFCYRYTTRSRRAIGCLRFATLTVQRAVDEDVSLRLVI